MRNLPWLLALVSFPAFAEPPLPPPAQREAMLRAMASQLERLDGEALLVRERNRRLPFAEVAADAASSARDASSWGELLRAFARLDAAFPNLHSRFQPGSLVGLPARRRFAAGIAPEWAADGTTGYRVSRVSAGAFEGADAPRPGDRLVAVNGRAVSAWQEENLEYCKWPLRQQCDLMLPDNLRAGLLPSWSAGAPLAFTLEREGRRFSVAVPLEAAPPSQGRDEAPCRRDHALYPDFAPGHEGRHACAYVLKGDPSVALLRIQSFYYEDDGSAIRSVDDEVNALRPWWEKHAPGIRHLIIDLADNTGGEAPIAYYEILFEKPFQEQYVRFRKLPELENDALRRDGFFWGETGQEAWYQSLRRDGTWDATPWSGFLPPVPMFCATEGDCREGLFEPRNPGFHGNVTLVLNAWCVSSCDGFAFTVKDQLGARVSVAGQPQSADSAYSRASLHLFLDPSREAGFRLEVGALADAEPAGALLSQTVVITRSVAPDGTITSGLPLPVDRFVPLQFNQDEGTWRSTAVKAVEN